MHPPSRIKYAIFECMNICIYSKDNSHLFHHIHKHNIDLCDIYLYFENLLPHICVSKPIRKHMLPAAPSRNRYTRLRFILAIVSPSSDMSTTSTSLNLITCSTPRAPSLFIACRRRSRTHSRSWKAL